MVRCLRLTCPVDSTAGNVVFLIVAGAATALACGLGAIPVFILRNRLSAWEPLLRGLAAGSMVAASVEGLFRPALKVGGFAQTAAGCVLGVLFLLVLRWLMHGHVGNLRGSSARRSSLVFTALFIHSLPEGLAIGAAHASEVAQLNVFVLAAIGLQNIPEGTAVALPMAGSGCGKGAQFWAAVLTSVPQPIGAPLAFVLVDRVRPLLPASLGFAAGAMLAVVALELAPEALGRKLWRQGAAGALAGVLAMVALSAALGV